MNIIFLDIDGVLNSGNYIKRLDGKFDDPQFQMDPDAVVRLNALTTLTGASIVVSSTWRLAFRHSAYPLRQLRTCLASYKLTGDVIDMTGVVSGGRSYEIQEWLDTHSEVEHYVIFDDDTVEGFGSHFIKTQFMHGLQDEHVRQAVTILGYK